MQLAASGSIMMARSVRHETLAELLIRIRELLDGQLAMQRDIAELRRAVAAQTKAQRRDGAGPDDLRAFALETYDAMLRCGQETRASLTDLRAALGELASPITGSDPNGRTRRLRSSPPARLSHDQYHRLIARVHEVGSRLLPASATVLVISKGDQRLLNIPGRRGWHFPQTEDGGYAGHYPADSAAAIEHLEALRARGAEFLLIPKTAFWWLDHYTHFAQHLKRRYGTVLHDNETCVIFVLRPAHRPGPRADGRERMGRGALAGQIQEIVGAVLPPRAAVLVISKGEEELLQVVGPRAGHFPQAESGVYAGYHPADSATAIAHLEALRSKGAEFLLIPRTTFWWLDHYKEFAQHLRSRYRLVVRQAHVCWIFALGEERRPTGGPKNRTPGHGGSGRTSG